jgi:hypothetical protein
VAAGGRVGMGRADGRAESGRSGEADQEPGEDRARRLSRLLRQRTRRDPWRGAARFDGAGRIARRPDAGAGAPELRRGPPRPRRAAGDGRATEGRRPLTSCSPLRLCRSRSR